MSFGPGMIGVPCGENARFSDFTPSIVGLQKPGGTVLLKRGGLGPAQPLNEIGETFFGMKHLEWLFLTNDDNLYPPETILRLLSYQKDFITGLYF
jgi:hypothetical protein